MVYHHFPDFSMATFLGESIRIEMATSCSCSRRIAFQFTSELPTILTGKLAAMNCASVGLCLHGASWKYNPFKSAQSIVLVHTCIIWICILILSITYRHISYHIISYHIISYHIISHHIISYHIIYIYIINNIHTPIVDTNYGSDPQTSSQRHLRCSALRKRLTEQAPAEATGESPPEKPPKVGWLG